MLRIVVKQTLHFINIVIYNNFSNITKKHARWYMPDAQIISMHVLVHDRGGSLLPLFFVNPWKSAHLVNAHNLKKTFIYRLLAHYYRGGMFITDTLYLFIETPLLYIFSVAFFARFSIPNLSYFRHKKKSPKRTQKWCFSCCIFMLFIVLIWYCSFSPRNVGSYGHGASGYRWIKKTHTVFDYP